MQSDRNKNHDELMEEAADEAWGDNVQNNGNETILDAELDTHTEVSNDDDEIDPTTHLMDAEVIDIEPCKAPLAAIKSCDEKTVIKLWDENTELFKSFFNWPSLNDPGQVIESTAIRCNFRGARIVFI